MAISIKNPEADRLVRELAARTGEGATEAVMNAVRERLDRVRKRAPSSLAEDIARIARRCAARPVLDDRRADDILGYGADGLPH
ncbi:MAG: type II toxin-antitoxin system VapB family antitoxin [Candidatus Eremiobacteraeota bacterium]|nr:type II toxin-antitoxin system VapB family antitoxin [Candidatus Eremiobacteraeota bacterium]